MECTLDIKTLQEKLEEEFLFNNNSESMYFLLSLYENEYDINKFKPKYTCNLSIYRALKRKLNYRTDKDDIISAVNKIIYDDVNRLELSIFLESYTRGYKNKDGADMLESYILAKYDYMNLFFSKTLFHNIKNKEIKKIKKKILRKRNEDKILKAHITNIANLYAESILKSKVYKINKIINKQLVLSYKNNKILIGGEEVFLNKRELDLIYSTITSCIIKSIKKISRSAMWHGINDKVLSRY